MRGERWCYAVGLSASLLTSPDGDPSSRRCQHGDGVVQRGKPGLHQRLSRQGGRQSALGLQTAGRERPRSPLPTSEGKLSCRRVRAESSVCSPQVPLDSIASHSGCKSGDYLVKIADKDVFDLGHEEAKELIRRAGNRLSLVLERGEKIVPSMNSAFPKQKSDEPIEEKAKTYSQMVCRTSDLTFLYLSLTVSLEWPYSSLQ